MNMDNDYFIKDCCNCEYVQILSLDGITIFKMKCQLTGDEITDSKLLCREFKIGEYTKIVRRISDEEAKRIENEVKQ